MPATTRWRRAPFVVAADLDGKRDGARIRLGAALDLDDVLAVAGDAVREHRSLGWDRDRDDLVERVARTLDRLDLGTDRRAGRRRARPTTAALLDHVRRSRLAALPMGAVDSLRARVAFLPPRDGDRWPDLADAALLRTSTSGSRPSSPAPRRRPTSRSSTSTPPSRRCSRQRAAELDRIAPESCGCRSGRA